MEVRRAPVEVVIAQGRRRERRRKAVATAGVAALVAAVGISGWLLTSSREPVSAGSVSENRLPLPWWGDGTLHLRHVRVPAPNLTDLVDLGDGVAYGTESGEVILVDSEGRADTIGTKSSEAPLACGISESLVAWVEPGVDQNPQLVVFDYADHSEVGRLPLPYMGPRWERLDGGSYPISIDAGRVYYATQDGDWSWAPGEDEPRRETPVDTDMVDQQAGTRITHTWTGRQGFSSRLVVTRPSFDDILLYRGEGGLLSPAGSYLAIRRGQSTEIFAVGSDDAISLEIPTPALPVQFGIAFAGDNAIVLVSGGQRAPESTESPEVEGPLLGPQYATWDVVVCNLTDQQCRTVKDVTTDGPPILPE
jgi:hypothetical protein